MTKPKLISGKQRNGTKIENQVLGISFIRELRLSLQHITNNPLMFPVIEHEVRRAVLRKFPYSTYFIDKPDAVVIIAVLHQQRRPRAWKSRR
ncbi:MAG TPA: hypothetical protein VIX17_04700 [Pyrinomonadaceae bacterium]